MKMRNSTPQSGYELPTGVASTDTATVQADATPQGIKDFSHAGAQRKTGTPKATPRSKRTTPGVPRLFITPNQHDAAAGGDGLVKSPSGSPSAFEQIDRILGANKIAGRPECASFTEYLETSARVPLRGGAYGPFSFNGRAPLRWIVDLTDKVLDNCLHGKTVEIDGVTFKPGAIKGATITVGGGAQWGKTVLVLNFQAFITALVFVNFGYYTPDQELLAKIVDTKFRPDVVDQQPWMASMIRVGIAENASGKTVNRKNSFQVSDGERKAFGHFCGMQKPPTTISLDAAALDEVDDIPLKNIGYVDGRMTGSPLALKWQIGTQRVAGAGQNQRVESGSFHRKLTPCPHCCAEWNLEENFPQIIRVALDGTPKAGDPSITPEMGHDRDARYYCACLQCGAELDRDAGAYAAKNPQQIKNANFSIRVSQLSISAISLQEIVGSWYSAMSDPSGEAMTAFYCDRIAIPHAGTAQPITAEVIERARIVGRDSVADRDDESSDGVAGYAMSLSGGEHPRFAGCDMGPRCWFWCDEVRSPFASALVWAEMIASGNMPSRIPLLMELLGIQCVFFDAGGEPDLTKRLVLAINGLDNFAPPVLPRAELLRSNLFNIGAGLQWDGARGLWNGLRAAAVDFSQREALGVVQTIGFTQEGKIYPLIKCNRGESIQSAVNDFLVPTEGVIEMVNGVVRKLPRARLPKTYIGAGAPQAVLETHLLNLRRVKDPHSGEEEWADKVENHLGLAKVYARLCGSVAGEVRKAPSEALDPALVETAGSNRWGITSRRNW